MTATILISAPATLFVSANRRIHWAQRHQIVKTWRQLASLHARRHDLPLIERAHVTITVRFPTAHRRDVGNLHPYVAKPIVDGLVDAGVLPDDSDTHLIGPDLRRDPDNGGHRVRIDIQELP